MTMPLSYLPSCCVAYTPMLALFDVDTQPLHLISISTGYGPLLAQIFLFNLRGRNWVRQFWKQYGKGIICLFFVTRHFTALFPLMWVIITPVRYNLDGDSTLDRNELLALLEDLMQVTIIMVAFLISRHLVFFFFSCFTSLTHVVLYIPNNEMLPIYSSADLRWKVATAMCQMKHWSGFMQHWTQKGLGVLARMHSSTAVLWFLQIIGGVGGKRKLTKPTILSFATESLRMCDVSVRWTIYIYILCRCYSA